MISKRSTASLFILFAATAIAGYSLYKTSPVTEKVEQPVVTSPVFATPTVEMADRLVTSGKNISPITLSSKNTVVLIGEIAGNGSQVAQEIIEKSKSNKVLYVVINSPGGSVLDGALIVSAIQSAKVPVNTVCLQLCASMAAIIHQYGTERLQVDRSILMFHDAAGGLQGYFPHMKSRLEMLSSYINKMNIDISRRTGMPLKDFVQAEHEELWMDAEDAVKRKFTEKIVSVQFEASLLESPLKEKLFSPMTSSKLGLELKDNVR